MPLLQKSEDVTNTYQNSLEKTAILVTAKEKSKVSRKLTLITAEQGLQSKCFPKLVDSMIYPDWRINICAACHFPGFVLNCIIPVYNQSTVTLS